MSYMFEYVF